MAGAPPEDRLPKNGRGEEEGEEVGGPPSEAASCRQIESDPRAGGRWPSVTGRLGQPALPLPLQTSSSSCPDPLPARQAGRLPRRRSEIQPGDGPLSGGAGRGGQPRLQLLCLKLPATRTLALARVLLQPRFGLTRPCLQGGDGEAPASAGAEPRRVGKKRIQSWLGISWAERARRPRPQPPARRLLCQCAW